MSRATYAELLPVLRERYGRRGRQARRRMLDEFCEQFGYSRKHAIKVLRAKLPAPGGRARPGPVRVCDADVLRVTKALWLRRRLCGTKPGSLLRTQIPMHNEARDVSRPGCGCPERSRRGWKRTPSPTAAAALRASCQRPPALPFGLPAAGCLAPLGSSGA